MKNINTASRSKEPEVMDDFELQGKELEKTLKDIDKVNNWLGGNSITINGIQEILKTYPGEKVISIADVGCGNGNILREIAAFGRKENLSLILWGIDGNPHAIKIAEELSADDPEISYKTMNIFSEEFKKMKFDILLCTLTLHHFQDEEIVELLKVFIKMSGLGIVINDLHRSKRAYYLFKLFCSVFVHNKIARQDGLISILRGFKKEDLERYASKIKVSSQKIRWKWAFRYQWVLITGPEKERL